ncbi:monooxygenase [Rhodospirillaceae bacterium KN72]|uniref:Monooxygenase n=1 Tax=Pacificispira spongiicola TaxID=2729598 RepID=A0A7Y0DZK9_9PROT|nr:FAD-dependent monooxygenase [Pacificispira spongiicola]NMM44471.1 monooxygenase [Pacificispira spongiicola]
MRVAIIGGGPAGLYTGYLLRRAFPDAQIDIVEQNPENVTWGFGVVFSDSALDFLREDDPETHDAIVPHMEMWRDLTLDMKGEKVVIDGVGFAAIGRLHLLQLLTERARAVGLDPKFGTVISDLDAYKDYDLIVGADGLNSLVRQSGDFGTSLEYLDNKFAWYGTTKRFDTLTQSFRESRLGRFNAHHYRYSDDMSTFIVETDGATWKAAGFEGMDAATTKQVCEEIFADVLDGEPLVANNSVWRNFPKLWNETWYNGNRVLLGDSLHTAHFSIGSGTRLAMEDAIALVKALTDNSGDVATALPAYQAARKPIVEKIVTAANLSAHWYEDFVANMDLPAWEFADRYIRRAGRIDDERLRKLAPRFMAGLEAYRG